MAKDISKKNEFILLRAEGRSYSFITQKLAISKTTCIKWNKELEEKILEQKQDNLSDLYSAYNLTKEARIERLGTTLKKIDSALEKVDYSTIAPEKLLDFKLKYTQALKDEYKPFNMAYREMLNCDDYIIELKALLTNIRSDDYFNKLSTEQLNNELLLLREIKKATQEAGKINDDNELRIIIDDMSQEGRLREFNKLMGYDDKEEAQEVEVEENEEEIEN
jgi:transposase